MKKIMTVIMMIVIEYSSDIDDKERVVTSLFNVVLSVPALPNFAHWGRHLYSYLTLSKLASISGLLRIGYLLGYSEY